VAVLDWQVFEIPSGKFLYTVWGGFFIWLALQRKRKTSTLHAADKGKKLAMNKVRSVARVQWPVARG
jgi:hypothetical protein